MDIFYSERGPKLAFFDHLILSSFTIEIRQSTIEYAGLLGRWDEWLIDQVSDAPSIFSFHYFLQDSLQKLFQIIFL